MTTRRACFGIFSAIAVLLTSACDPGGDERSDQITPGISRDSALVLLRTPPATTAVAGDTMPNVWRLTAYLVGGQYIETIWYSPDNEKRTVYDTIPEGRIIPIVLADTKVVGVGRRTYDSVARARNLPRNRY